MDNQIEIMKNIKLLKPLPEEILLQNLKSGAFNTVAYRKNAVIHFDGDKCDRLEIVLKGRVAVDRIDEEGSLLSIANFYSGDILGGNLLFSQKPYYPMTVSAELDTEIVEIKKEVFFNLLYNNPLLLKTFLEFVSDRAFILGSKIKHYLNKTIRESLFNFLEFESKKQGSNRVKLYMSKKALSEKIGVQRTSLSRELAKMRQEGLIEFDRHTITLLKQGMRERS